LLRASTDKRCIGRIVRISDVWLSRVLRYYMFLQNALQSEADALAISE